MNKQEFLKRLRKGLSGLSQCDMDERLRFYGEMIDDRMEDGLSESEAVAEMGEPEEAAEQIMDEVISAKLKKKRGNAIMAFAAMGSPLWFPVLAVILISVYAVIWSAVVTVWAVLAALWGCSLTAAAGIVLICMGNAPQGLAFMGTGAVCAGLAFMLSPICKLMMKGAVAATVYPFAVIRKRRAQ